MSTQPNPYKHGAASAPSSFQPVTTRTALPMGRIFSIFCLTLGIAHADFFGDFTYEDMGETITITDYPTTATGPVEIPASIPVGEDPVVMKPVTAIGTQAFAQCSLITSVIVPEGVVSIGSGAFLGCSAMSSVSLPASLQSLDTQSFYQCLSLTSITLPSGVTVLPDSLFDGCTGLTSVTLGPNVTNIGNFAFFNCRSLTAISLPGTVTFIGTQAFSECVALQSITIPTNVTSIGTQAFSACVALQSITIPTNVTSMGDSVFSKCTALASATLSAGVPALPRTTFEDCTALTSVTIPEGVIELGVAAFRRCTALTSVSLPASMTSVATDSFSRCTSLTSINVHPSNLSLSSLGGVLFNKTQTLLRTYPAGITGPYAVPSSVTQIGASAFRFGNVGSVTIHSGVTLIGLEAFGSCPQLTAITVDPANPSFQSNNGVLLNKSGTTLLSYPTGRAGAYTIPAGVTTIGAAAFRSSQLTAVTIPASVTTLNTDCFATCPLLVSATFEGNAPTTLGARIFANAAPGFKVRFNPGAVGFTVPTWQGYPSEELGSTSPVAAWLIANSLPANADLNSDDNNDGVNLLMAYALNLDPNLNLSGSLPQPLLENEALSLSYYSGAAGVTYVVETSNDLSFWTTQGVTISQPNVNQVRTASVPVSDGSRYLRLKVSN
ncbi:MAG: leucine-rich repeat domain-containing protein [Akkermansiaceae bacterium]|nr:leucine-rich repeat domain-containing protein [Akkermansiaceae bacterium]